MDSFMVLCDIEWSFMLYFIHCNHFQDTFYFILVLPGMPACAYIQIYKKFQHISACWVIPCCISILLITWKSWNSVVKDL